MHIQPLMPQLVWLGSTRPYTAVLPWYEEDDFAELMAIGGHGEHFEGATNVGIEARCKRSTTSCERAS